MSLFGNQNNAQNAPSPAVDKNSPAYAVRQFGVARSNLLLAVILTAVNILLSVVGADIYLLFSISFPYYMFSLSSVVDVVLPLVVLAFYLCCYLFSKKKPGFMIAAMVAFILDCLFLVGFSMIAVNEMGGEISYVDFLLDYLVHIWVMVYLIIGTRYCRRYKAAINPCPEMPVYPGQPYPAPMYYPMPEQPADAYAVPYTSEAYPTAPDVVDETVSEPVDETDG